jgi:hypothetical protein
MRRRSRTTLAPAVIALTLALAPAAAAQSVNIEGSFKGGTIRPEAPSCAGVLCSTGSLEPFGTASVVYSPITFEQVSQSCFDVTAVLQITLTEGGDRLDLATDSTACFPGNSPNTPGSARSWGNPVTDTGTWIVASGTGIFAGATGEGTFSARTAGAESSAHLSGELQLEES